MLGLLFLGLAARGAGGGGPQALISDRVNPSGVASRPTESDEQDAPGGVTFPNFKPAEFPFVTTIPDDGTGKGGGWQVAKVNLEFMRIVLPFTVIKWYCPFNIEMPLRNEAMGVISASRAATMSATVANSVAAAIDYKLPQGIFCHKFVEGVKVAFPPMYPGLGARVTR